MDPMTWNQTEVYQERIRFIDDWFADEFCFAARCERYQISRKTGYKLIERFGESPQPKLGTLIRIGLSSHGTASVE